MTEFSAAFRLGEGYGARPIAVAAREPAMRVVPVKAAEQPAILSSHRARAGFQRLRQPREE